MPFKFLTWIILYFTGFSLFEFLKIFPEEAPKNIFEFLKRQNCNRGVLDFLLFHSRTSPDVEMTSWRQKKFQNSALGGGDITRRFACKKKKKPHCG